MLSAGGGQSGVAEKLRQIELRLHEVQDVVQAVDLVLQLLDVMQGNPAQMNDSSRLYRQAFYDWNNILGIWKKCNVFMVIYLDTKQIYK